MDETGDVLPTVRERLTFTARYRTWIARHLVALAYRGADYGLALGLWV
jgi:hypothetical protein